LADRILVPSEFLQRIFAAHGLRAEILPNVAEAEQFAFTLRNRFAPRLIVARNLTPIYDVGTILRAFAIIQRRYQDAKLSVVGTGRDANSLTELARQLGLRNVTFHGAVPNSEMPKLYAEHDIALNASVFDNFPGALVEAALAGLAVVSTGSGGIPDMFECGKTALLVKVGDHQQMARSVLECIEHPEDTCQRTLLARTWAEQFAWANVFPIFKHFYGLDSSLPMKDFDSSPCEELSPGNAA
jgi:glycosyltransferase involved in cell wall biosynthesis